MSTDRRLGAYRILAIAVTVLLVALTVSIVSGGDRTTTVILNESWQASPRAVE